MTVPRPIGVPMREDSVDVQTQLDWSSLSGSCITTDDLDEAVKFQSGLEVKHARHECEREHVSL